MVQEPPVGILSNPLVNVKFAALFVWVMVPFTSKMVAVLDPLLMVAL